MGDLRVHPKCTAGDAHPSTCPVEKIDVKAGIRKLYEAGKTFLRALGLGFKRELVKGFEMHNTKPIVKK